MFFKAPSDVLLGVHSDRTKVLVSMGDDYTLVLANFLKDSSLEFGEV